jgi:mono/diheme cytochrome c family protein
MPAFGERLDAAQIKLVVAWLGRETATGNSTPR